MHVYGTTHEFVLNRFTGQVERKGKDEKETATSKPQKRGSLQSADYSRRRRRRLPVFGWWWTGDGVRFGDTNLNGRFMFLLRKRKLFNYLIPSGRASLHAPNECPLIQTLRWKSQDLLFLLLVVPGEDDYRILTVTSGRIQLRFLALHNFLRRRNFRVAIMQIKRSLSEEQQFIRPLFRNR